MTDRRAGQRQEVLLLLTAQCNLRCTYCYQNAKQPRAMAWDVAAAALDLLLASPQPELAVSFLGGEPLLEFPLLERSVEYAVRRVPAGRTLSWHVVTNATLLDAAALAFVARHGVRLTISCDGAAAAQSLRQADSFAILETLFETLRVQYPEHLRQRVAVSVTLVPEAVPHLGDSFDYLLATGVPEIVIDPVMGQREWSDSVLQTLDRQFERVFRASLEHRRQTGLVPFTRFRRRGTSGPRRRAPAWGCSAPLGGALAVDVDGQVYPCVLVARSYQAFAPALDARMQALSLGDVRDGGLQARLATLADVSRRSGLFEPTRRQHSGRRLCATCRDRYACFVCPVARAHGPGADINDVPRYLCAFNRVVSKYRQRFLRQPSPGDTFWRYLHHLREERARGVRG